MRLRFWRKDGLRCDLRVEKGWTYSDGRRIWIAAHDPGCGCQTWLPFAPDWVTETPGYRPR